MVVPWTALFWLGFIVLVAIHSGAGVVPAGVGLAATILMFVGSKIGREFLGLA